MNILSQKEIATEFLRLAASGHVQEAYDKYADKAFFHHNPFFRCDANSLMRAMEENAVKHPKKVLKIQRALQDGDLVAVHSHMVLNPGEYGVALVHIFRFKNSRIAELWDIGQPVPEIMPNERGMF